MTDLHCYLGPFVSVQMKYFSISGKKNPIQVYFRSFVQVKYLGESMVAALLSHNFPLCPGLGNGSETERFPLNLFLGEQFSNRKHRFHWISYGFLGLFPREEVFNWKSRLHRWFWWECMDCWYLKDKSRSSFPDVLSFSLHQDRKLWEIGKGSTVLTCQVDQRIVQLADQPYSNRPLHSTGNSSHPRGLTGWKCSHRAAWSLPVCIPAVCLARILAPDCFCSRAGLDAVGEAEHGLANLITAQAQAFLLSLPTQSLAPAACSLCLTPLSPQHRNTLGVSRSRVNYHSCQDPQSHTKNLCSTNQIHVFQTLVSQTLLSKQSCPSCPSHHCPESCMVLLLWVNFIWEYSGMSLRKSRA